MNRQSILTNENFRNAIELVNEQGFAALDAREEISATLGRDLYLAMNDKTFHPSRPRYYNEIAFHWPEDWKDVEGGLTAFHNEKSLRYILTADEAETLMTEQLGAEFSTAILKFASDIKTLTIGNHFGLEENSLRLARVMVRQMGEHDQTVHGGSHLHEDIGYSDRAYQQLLSVIVTTHGIPTEAERYKARAGDILIFNAFDRRRLLGMGDDLAFVHRGPSTGPKMFFFFEFLGPR